MYVFWLLDFISILCFLYPIVMPQTKISLSQKVRILESAKSSSNIRQTARLYNVYPSHTRRWRYDIQQITQLIEWVYDFMKPHRFCARVRTHKRKSQTQRFSLSSKVTTGASRDHFTLAFVITLSNQHGRNCCLLELLAITKCAQKNNENGVNYD